MLVVIYECYTLCSIFILSMFSTLSLCPSLNLSKEGARKTIQTTTMKTYFILEIMQKTPQTYSANGLLYFWFISCIGTFGPDTMLILLLLCSGADCGGGLKTNKICLLFSVTRAQAQAQEYNFRMYDYICSWTLYSLPYSVNKWTDVEHHPSSTYFVFYLIWISLSTKCQISTNTDFRPQDSQNISLKR